MNKNEKFEINHIKSSSFSEVQIFNTGYEKTSAKKSPRVLTDFGSFSMHFVLSGSGYFQCEGKTFAVEKNQMFCIFPNIQISYYPNKKNPWSYTWMDFYGTKVSEMFSSLGVTARQPIIQSASAQIGKLFLENVSECKKHINASDFISLSYFYRIMSLLAIQNNVAPIKQLLDYGSPSLVEQALSVIENSYTDSDFDLRVLACQLGVSSAYLSRLIKQGLGTTFTEYLRKKRIQQAVTLFDQTTLSIQKVADLTGFSDPYYFSAVFKKITSLAPRDYIKQQQKGNRTTKIEGP